MRAVATGRSLYSARTVMTADFPIDYLVFSSGAGVVSWADGRLLRSRTMAPDVVSALVARLRTLALDFMVHHAVPDTHCFHFFRSSDGGNADFERRIERYGRFSQRLCDGVPGEVEVSQLLVVEPPGTDSHRDLLAREFGDVHVVRTTSPLDHASTWIELFPVGVSKAHATDWIRGRYGIGRTRTIAVGNDYNDLDMLEWAGRGVCGLECAAVDARALRGGPVERRGRVRGGGASSSARRVIGASCGSGRRTEVPARPGIVREATTTTGRATRVEGAGS